MQTVNIPQFKQPPPPKHPFQFKPEKALEAIIYLTNRLPSNKRSRLFINKLLYFADLKHLEDYSRYIAGDFYVAMREGPVPSNSYNMLKEIAGVEDHGFGLNYDGCFRVSEKKVFFDPLRDANTELLSQSDIECLEYALQTYADLDNDDISEVSHDDTYNVVVAEKGLNRPMEVTHFARFLEGGEDLINLLAGER